MAEKKVIELEVKTNSEDIKGKFASLKSEISKTTEEVEQLTSAYGENSDEVKQAAQQLESLKTAYKDLNKVATDVGATFEEVYGDLQPLTTRMGEAEDRLYELTSAGKTNSKEYKDLLGVVAQYKRTMMETDMVVDAASTTMSSKLGGAVTGVASAFSAAEGAMALVGVESEDLQATMVKLQAVMALSEGLNGIKESRAAFTMLKTVAVDALKGIKTGLLTTGIGALVVALGLIVAYWDDIKAAVSGVSEEQKKLNTDSQANLDVQKAKLTAIDSQENILKLQGKSEREILNIKIAQTNEVINATKQQLKNSENTALAQIEASKRNKEILSGILQFISTPISAILRTVDAVGKAFGKDFGLNDKLYGSISGFVFDPEKTKKEIAAVKEETEKGLKELENTKAGFVLSVKAIDKTAEDERKTNQKTASDKAAEDEKKRREDNLKEIESLADDMDASRKRRVEKQLEDQKKAADAELQIQSDKITAQAELDQKNAEDKKAFDAKEIEDAKNLQAAKYDTVRAGLTTIGDLAIAFAGKSEKEKKRAFNIQKAANIAGAVMDTYKAANGAYASMSGIPYVGPFLGAAAAGVAIAAGIANVKNISSQQFGGGASGSSAPSGTGSGGGGANNQAITPNFNIIGNQNQTQLAQLNQAPIKAYVVGSDVTTQQMLDKKKIQNATL
jgi:hypothetical protein